MSEAVEWIYEVWFSLPFGWKVIRLKSKFVDEYHYSFNTVMLYKKKEIKPFHFRDIYWPRPSWRPK